MTSPSGLCSAGAPSLGRLLGGCCLCAGASRPLRVPPGGVQAASAARGGPRVGGPCIRGAFKGGLVTDETADLRGN